MFTYNCESMTLMTSVQNSSIFLLQHLELPLNLATFHVAINISMDIAEVKNITHRMMAVAGVSLTYSPLYYGPDIVQL